MEERQRRAGGKEKTCKVSQTLQALFSNASCMQPDLLPGGAQIGLNYS